MRSRQLEYFVRICELGSITKAAAALNIAQPALGTQVRALEEEFGAKLLERTARGTELTEAGQLFLEESRLILSRLQELKRVLSERGRDGPPTITIGLTPSLTTVLASPLLRRARDLLPEISLHLYEEFSHNLVEQVADGKLDLALAYSVPPNRNLRRDRRLEERLFFVCKAGSEFDEPGPMPFRRLVEARFAMPSDRDFVRRLVEETLCAQQLSIDITYHVESMQAMKELIAQGMACGVLPYGTVAREVEAGRLAARPVVDPPITRSLYLVQPLEGPRDRERHRLRVVLEELIEELPGRYDAFFPLKAGPAALPEIMPGD